jgi:hypothetical protein
MEEFTPTHWFADVTYFQKPATFARDSPAKTFVLGSILASAED